MDVDYKKIVMLLKAGERMNSIVKLVDCKWDTVNQKP